MTSFRLDAGRPVPSVRGDGPIVPPPIARDNQRPNIKLECGHEQSFMGHIRRGKQVFCERCCKYFLPAKPPERKLPDPMVQDEIPF